MHCIDFRRLLSSLSNRKMSFFSLQSQYKLKLCLYDVLASRKEYSQTYRNKKIPFVFSSNKKHIQFSFKQETYNLLHSWLLPLSINRSSILLVQQYLIKFQKNSCPLRMSNVYSLSNPSVYLFKQKGVQTDSIITQFDSIDKYLNLRTFSFKPQQAHFPQKQPNEQAQEQVDSFYQSSQTAKIKREKSSFHNFQKHLITIIKKFVIFSRNKLLLEEPGALAYAIWTAFLEVRAANKRALNLVFGVFQINSSRLQLHSISMKNEAFHKIYSDHSYEEICAAQKMLREKVVVQVRTLSKQFLKSNCSIGRFEQFHLYFRGLIDEIEAGPLTRRMSKEAKARIMPKEIPDSSDAK